jgi:RNA polymerase sigma-70 factor (ECF subfamily)
MSVAVAAADEHAGSRLSVLSILAALLHHDPTGDADLLRRIAGGDAAALRVLYDALAGRVVAIAQRILGDRQAAEDVAQETFVEAWRRAGQYDPARGGATAFVMTIARSRAIDRKRGAGTAQRALEAARAEPNASGAPLPFELAEQRRERERVLAALSALPAEQRAAIELAYFEGLTQREIAERTGEPLGTVKTRVRLGMARLAGLLAEGEEAGRA